ncbi:MAG: PEP-CTERM sorting domain-containing protein [Verrucomicrobiota bacterium]|nr:PEP-CTERM sorting domain-containing protein [Verrucomicrobiota bacterium]
MKIKWIMSAILIAGAVSVNAEVVSLYNSTNDYVTANSNIGFPWNEASGYRASSMGGSYFSLTSGQTKGTAPTLYGGYVTYDAGGGYLGTPARITNGATDDYFQVVQSVANEAVFGVALMELNMAAGESLESLYFRATGVNGGDSATLRWAVVDSGNKLYVSQASGDLTTALQFTLADAPGTSWVEWNPLTDGATPGGTAAGNAGDIDFDDAYAGAYDAAVDFSDVTKVGFIYDMAEADAVQRLIMMKQFTATVIPEPATLGLVAFAVVALVGVRRLRLS